MCVHSSFWKEGGAGADLQTAGHLAAEPAGLAGPPSQPGPDSELGVRQQLSHHFAEVLKSL